MKTRILIIFLIFTFAFVVRAQEPRAPEIEIPTTELVFPGVTNMATIPTQKIQVRNIGADPLTISSVTLSDTTNYEFVGALPTSVASQATALIEVKFHPKSTVDNGLVMTADVVISSNDSDEPTRTVKLYGLSTEGLEGNLEPSLKNVLTTLGYNLNPGFSGLTTSTSATPIGDEVIRPLFHKAGPGNITLKPVGRFSPDEPVPFGFYVPNGSSAMYTEVGVISQKTSNTIQYPPNFQTLNPILSSGKTTFDPGYITFGIYADGISLLHTEDSRNTATDNLIRHAARIYPLKNRSGQLVANSYLIGFEDRNNGDYQDYMFILSNVVDANSPVPTPTFTKTPIPPTATPTNTAVPPTATPTDTPEIPTNTPTDEPTSNPTEAPTDTAEAATAQATMNTETPVFTESATPEGPTATSTFTATPSSTPDLSTGVELLVNGGFEIDTQGDNLPDSWDVKRVTNDRIKCNKDKNNDGIFEKIFSMNGKCAWMFRSGTGENALIMQMPAAVGQVGDTFALSAHTKAKPGVSARLVLTVKYNDSSLPTTKIKKGIKPSESYTPIFKLVPVDGTVSKIKVRIQHFSTSGKLFVDDVSLLWVQGGNGLLPLP